MFGISFEELLVLAVLTLILFGPEKMVEYAAKAGRLVARARRLSEELVQQVRQAGSQYVEPIKELRQDLLPPLTGREYPTPPPSPYPEFSFCPHCGARQESGFTFCPACGTRLKGPTP